MGPGPVWGPGNSQGAGACRVGGCARGWGAGGGMMDLWLLCFPLRTPEGQGCNRSSHTRGRNISAQQDPWAQPPSLHLHPTVHMLVPARPRGAPHPARPWQGSLRWLHGTVTTGMPVGPFFYSGARQRCTRLRRCLPTPGPQRALPTCPVPAGGGTLKIPHTPKSYYDVVACLCAE